jgi:predicted deacetylase
MRSMCVVVHDVAPSTWGSCRRLLAGLAEIGDFPVTLLAVPRFHGDERDQAFERWLVERARGGDEIALHGYTHLDEGRPRGPVDFFLRRLYTRGEGEFWDLPQSEASSRLDAGLAWMRELGLAPAGFVAPAWLLGRHAAQALRTKPFVYTCTLNHVRLMPEERNIVCQSQVYSNANAWRRTMSVAWNALLAWRQRNELVVRLELHPADADCPRLKASWQGLAREQSRTRSLCTLLTLTQRFKTGQGLMWL